MGSVFAFLELWVWPLLALLVSLAYFHAADAALSLGRRIAVSAHGGSIAALHLGAFAIALAGWSHPKYGTPFLVALLVPLVLMGYSLFAFRGRNSVHWLQLVNVVALFWAAFIGVMSITGEWL